MRKHDVKVDDYACPQAGESILVTLTYAVHGSGMRALVKFDCKGCYNCGVGKEQRPGSWVFDWSKCVNPVYRAHRD